MDFVYIMKDMGSDMFKEMKEQASGRAEWSQVVALYQSQDCILDDDDDDQNSLFIRDKLIVSIKNRETPISLVIRLCDGLSPILFDKMIIRVYDL